MTERWEYGGAYKRHDMSGEIRLPGGSVVEACDIAERLPSFMLGADTIFTDPPWNTGNLKSFYTKAGGPPCPMDFDEFSRVLWSRLDEIAPATVFMEMGKRFLGEHLAAAKARFGSVTFYNSTYYRRQGNKCYVIHATNTTPKRYKELEDMDEAAAIEWVCMRHDYDCIGDPCRGRGLVGRHAFLAGRRFVGTELNPKRLAVLVDFVRRASS